jgi:hypothetical protein
LHEVRGSKPSAVDGTWGIGAGFFVNASALPHLVVCSRVTDVVERNTLAWVELYPDNNTTESVVSLAGEKSIYPDMDFETLLSVLDETEHLYETA